MAARPDYRDRLDADALAFIDLVNERFPAEAGRLDIAGQRKVYDEMSQSFHAPAPDRLAVRDHVLPPQFGAVRIREYMPERPQADMVLLYFHGGGYVFGDLDSHGDICAEMASRSGMRAISVDYRLAPEHRHPAAFDDALSATAWLAAQGSRVLLVGESAGGNLVAAVSGRLGGLPALAGQLLIYPGLGGDHNKGSYVEHAHAPLLATADLDLYLQLRTGGRFEADDPILFPLRADDFAGLPPTIVVTAECDPLADDGPDYARRIVEAGGVAHSRCEARLFHGFLRGRRMIRRAGEAFETIIGDLRRLAA